MLDTKNNLKKSTKTGLMILSILVFLGIAFSFYTFISDFTGKPLGIQVHICLVFLMYFVVLLYSFWGYRKPHGNMLRFAMFVFGLMIIFKLVLPGRPDTSIVNFAANACDGFAAALITFISGRLQKIDKNKKLMIFVGVLMIVGILLLTISNSSFSITSFIRALSQPICWASLCLAYTARYELHREAGLAEQ